MRHIPPVEWIIGKLDGDVRRRLTLVLSSLESTAADEPQHAAGDQEVRAICRALDRVADLARHERTNGQSSQLTRERVLQTLDHAIANLRTVDANLFGRRLPYQTLDRSKAEPLYGAFLSALCHLEALTKVVRSMDGTLDERLLEGLVVLQEPLRREPIAL